MKLNVLAIALAASAIGAFSASAQTVIEERRDPAAPPANVLFIEVPTLPDDRGPPR